MNTLNSIAAIRIDWRVLGGVALLHGLAILSLFSAKPAVQPLGREQPLMVNLIELARPMPKPAESPRPRMTAAPKPVSQLPILSAASPSPAAMGVSVPEATARPEMTKDAAVDPVHQAVATAVSTAVVVVPPRFDADYLNNPAPVYPSLSRRLGEEGKVLLRVLVDPDGGVAQVEIKTSSGFERLDHAAISAVRKWRFVPARQGGAAIGAWVVVPISFSLRS